MIFTAQVSKTKKVRLLSRSFRIPLAGVVDDVAAGTADGYGVPVGHLQEDGEHLDQVRHVTQGYAQLNVVASRERVRVG